MSERYRHIPGIGPTGKFPEGKKLNESDEGEIRVAVGSDKELGMVFLSFGKSVSWLSIGPDGADQVADLLKEHAAKIRGL